MESISKFISEDNLEAFNRLTPEAIGSMLNTILTEMSDIDFNSKNEEKDLPSGDEENDLEVLLNTPPESSLHQVKNTFLGQIGEQNAEELIKKHYNVEIVAKRAKTADLIVKFEFQGKTYRILVEVKNYNSVVPTKEIEKMYRDLDTHNYACGAIMVSINTPIGTKKARHIQYDTRVSSGIKKPVMFIYGWSTIEKFLPTALEIIFAIASSKRTTNLTQEDLSPCINQIEEAIDGLSQARTRVLEAQNAMNKHFAGITAELIGSESSIKEQLRVMWNKMKIEETQETKIDSPLELVGRFEDSLNDLTKAPFLAILTALMPDTSTVVVSSSTIELKGGKFPIQFRLYKSGRVRCRATFNITQTDSMPATNLLGSYSLKDDRITMDVSDQTIGYICTRK